MSWRDEVWERISVLAGLDTEGGILPPPAGFTIDRLSGNTWWRNRAMNSEPNMVSMGLTIEAPYPGWTNDAAS